MSGTRTTVGWAIADQARASAALWRFTFVGAAALLVLAACEAHFATSWLAVPLAFLALIYGGIGLWCRRDVARYERGSRILDERGVETEALVLSSVLEPGTDKVTLEYRFEAAGTSHVGLSRASFEQGRLAVRGAVIRVRYDPQDVRLHQFLALVRTANEPGGSAAVA